MIIQMLILIGEHRIEKGPFLMAFTIGDNVAASQFLSKIFDWLNKNKIPHCVQRNYQGYPEKITGDVDLVISDRQIFTVIDGIHHVAKRTGWSCYLQHAWEKTAYLGFYQAVFPNRFTLTIELFAGGRWHGIPYLSSSEIFAKRISHKNTWRPHPVHQAVITMMHHLLYNGQVPVKYREEVLCLVEDNLVLFKDVLAKSIGAKLAKEVTGNLVEKKWDAISNKAHIYQAALMGHYALRHPITLVSTLLDGFAAKKTIPEGVVLVVNGESEEFQNKLCQELLELADKWHIFVPPIRKIISSSSESLLDKRGRVVSQILNRGGVVIVNNQTKIEVVLENSFPIYTINCHKDECFIETGHVNDRKLISLFPLDNSMKLAYQLWDCILADRCQITKVWRSSGG